jgi:hypothetical protein
LCHREIVLVINNCTEENCFITRIYYLSTAIARKKELQREIVLSVHINCTEKTASPRNCTVYPQLHGRKLHHSEIVPFIYNCTKKTASPRDCTVYPQLYGITLHHSEILLFIHNCTEENCFITRIYYLSTATAMKKELQRETVLSVQINCTEENCFTARLYCLSTIAWNKTSSQQKCTIYPQELYEKSFSARLYSLSTGIAHAYTPIGRQSQRQICNNFY